MSAADHDEWVSGMMKKKKKKGRVAVWVVSNCNDTLGAVDRARYVDQLVDSRLDLDRFGLCFDRKVRGNIYQFLAPYKFYLAFENSRHCKDYVTEKFWRNGLLSHAVPVVWGPTRDDVRAVAPPRSYIHAEDFASPAALVRHLRFLDENDDEYRKYFEWRRRPPTEARLPAEVIRPGFSTAMCAVCRDVSQSPGGQLAHKRLPSVMRFMFGGLTKECLASDKKNKLAKMRLSSLGRERKS